MKKAMNILAAATLFGSLLGASAPAAVSTQRSYDLTTRMVERHPGVGEFDGSLRIDVSSSGTISGYYRPADNPRFIPVTGGVTGDNLWLDIGTFARHPAHFTGTLRDGKIDAVADRPLLDNGAYTALELIGTPR